LLVNHPSPVDARIRAWWAGRRGRYNRANSPQFRARPYRLGYCFSVAWPFLALLLLLVAYGVEHA
jgi:hypothetical protein